MNFINVVSVGYNKWIYITQKGWQWKLWQACWSSHSQRLTSILCTIIPLLPRFISHALHCNHRMVTIHTPTAHPTVSNHFSSSHYKRKNCRSLCSHFECVILKICKIIINSPTKILHRVLIIKLYSLILYVCYILTPDIVTHCCNTPMPHSRWRRAASITAIMTSQTVTKLWCAQGETIKLAVAKKHKPVNDEDIPLHWGIGKEISMTSFFCDLCYLK